MAVISELRATLFPVDPGRPPIVSTTTVDGAGGVRAFVAEAIAGAERERPESMLLERGAELDSEPGRTREELAAFRFASFAGVGLDAARASWLRAYLAALGARLDEREAGPLTLFTGSALAAVERPGEPAWDDALGGDVFVPWHTGYDGDVEPRWLAAHDAPVREVVDGDPGAELLERVRRALAALGMHPAPLPVAPALYLLPLLAHPDKARAELGAARCEAALRLAAAVTAHSVDTLDADTRQQLELLCLGAAGFENGSRHALVRVEPPGLVVWAGDPEPAAAVLAAA